MQSLFRRPLQSVYLWMFVFESEIESLRKSGLDLAMSVSFTLIPSALGSSYFCMRVSLLSFDAVWLQKFC